MQITFKADKALQEVIYHWFGELKQRVYNRGIDFNSDDLMAVKDGEYIILMANIMLTDYDDNLVPFERRNVTIEHREQRLQPQPNNWDDSGRYLWHEEYTPTVSVTVRLMPIYHPELIVLLNEDGTLFKDGLNSKATLEKMVADNEIKHWESRLSDWLKILEKRD